jgi:choline dehydrogenase
MILIGFNHRGLGDAGRPSDQGAVAGAVYNAFSRGEVRLVSADPDVDPQVDENMLDDPRDRLRMRDVVRRLAVLCADPAMTRIAASIGFAETGLAMDDAAALPPDALDALMLQEAADAQHAAGTCRMTAYEEPRGVVDPDLGVKGIAGLGVADASIMPADCRANTHFTCVMIGLMAASRIAAAERMPA